jgi:ParB-like chromosome segregation protein Spo0J
MNEKRANEPKRVGPRLVPLSDLRAHPLNSNVMPEDFRAKLAAHIKQSGRYPMVIVRPHPEEMGVYEILDGHHRVEVLRELGHADVRCDVWNVDDREAKLLLATLNRLQGQDSPIRRAQLLHELMGELSLPDLAGLLPETDKQIQELEALLHFPADEIATLLADEAEREEKFLPRVLTFVVSAEQEELIDRAVELASDGTAGRDRKARGLANLARLYLDGKGDAVLEREA